MTPREFDLACDPDGDEEDSRPPGMSMQQYADWWRGLSPEARLARARERADL